MHKFTKRIKALFDVLRKPNSAEYSPEEVQVYTNDAISATQVKRLLAGTSDNPTYSTIEVLAGFFQVDAGYFFCDDEKVGEYLPERTLLIKEIAKRSVIDTHSRLLGDDIQLAIMALQEVMGDES